jgi:hypothetical protein
VLELGILELGTACAPLARSAAALGGAPFGVPAPTCISGPAPAAPLPLAARYGRHGNRPCSASNAGRPTACPARPAGELFPGPSKATRAYLHAEADVEAALQRCGFKVVKREMTATSFYFSRLLEAVKA